MEEDPSDQTTAARLKHDLKNQLGIVLGFVELILEDTPETDPRRKDLLEIRTATRASLMLVERMPPKPRAHFG